MARVEGNRVLGANNGEEDRTPLLSDAEQLMQAHPDLEVFHHLGQIYMIQQLPERERMIDIRIEREEKATRHYPTVSIIGMNAPKGSVFSYLVDDMMGKQYRYGLATIVRVHTENDEQVTVEVGYNQRHPYPHEYTPGRIHLVEKYAQPISPQELVTTARAGLEMLKAYGEATPDQQDRVDSLSRFSNKPPRIMTDSRQDMDEYLAVASPVLGELMRGQGISYDYVNTRPIDALNALNKVTDPMLPSEMPPVPQNRKEPARRKPGQ